MIMVSYEQVFIRSLSARIGTHSPFSVQNHLKMASCEIRSVFDYEIRGEYILNVI